MKNSLFSVRNKLYIKSNCISAISCFMPLLAKASLVLFIALTLLGASGCSSDDEKNSDQEERFTATFALSGDGYNESIEYNNQDNLIFCRLTGTEMWIRLARDKSANGNNSPHIDIDICNYVGAGTYTPVDPQNRPCPEGQLWNVFWHDGDRIYSNTETSSPCKLTLTLNDGIIQGVFNCSEVVRFEGAETIQISQGTFSCRIE